MANQIRLKRSAVQGKAPVVGDLSLGELAVNTYDGKLYMKKNDGSDAIVEIGGEPVVTSDTAPSSPVDGDLWYRTSDGRMYVYYDDGSTSQWVDANPNLPPDPDTFERSGTDVTLVNTGDNVGIGTTPAVKLDVSGEIRASSGVLFGTDTAAANVLDDYEEGTFNPLSGVSNLTGATVDRAVYTKIGRVVHIDCRIDWTGSTGTDNLIFNLPFAEGNTGLSSSNTGTVFYSGTSIFSGDGIAAHVPAGDTNVYFFKTSGGFSSVSANLVNGAYNWLFSVSYFV